MAIPSKPASARGRLISAHAGVTTLLCMLFALMYLDRINISAAASSIKQQFSLSNTEMGVAFSAFSWSYLASVFFGGWGARKFGARGVLVASVLLVGTATIATGFIGGLATLFAARFLVGLGEGPVFPAATQAMRNWYPPQMFGYIQGITHSASRLGGALAPPIVAYIIVLSNWHTSFYVLGAASIVWALVWLSYFRDDPTTHGAVKVGAMKNVTVVKSDPRAKVPFLALTRKFSPVTAVTFTYGWAYWVFVSWLPLYFFNYHHTDLKSSALLASVPFLAGVVGNTVGGSVSDYLLKRTGNIKTARCTVVSVSLAVCALLLLPIMFLSELVHIVPLLAASMLFLELTPAPMYAVTMDISKDFSGLGASFLIAGVAIAGIISPVVFGWLVDLTKNWNVPFATSIGILLMGAVIVTLWHVETEAPSQVLEA